MPRVFQRSGEWFVDVVVDGQRVKKRVGTKRQAEKRLAEMLAARESREAALLFARMAQPKASDPKASDLLEPWLKDRAAHGRKPKTITNYRTLVMGFLEVVGKTTKVSSITPAAASAYVTARRECGVSTQRINHGLVAVGSMLNWAVKQGRIAINAMERAEKVEVELTRERRALEDDEIEALLTKSPARYRRMWIALLASGLRTSQLAGLHWADVDFRRRTFRLLKSNTKNKREYLMPLHKDFEAVLREILAERPEPDPSEYVFLNEAGRPWRHNMLKRFYRCCEEAGIEHHRTRPDGVVEVVDLHSLRVSFASLLAENDVAPKVAQQLMQHSSVELTLGLYAKVRNGKEQAAVDGVRIVKGPKEAPAKRKATQA